MTIVTCSKALPCDKLSKKHPMRICTHEDIKHRVLFENKVFVLCNLPVTYNSSHWSEDRKRMHLRMRFHDEEMYERIVDKNGNAFQVPYHAHHYWSVYKTWYMMYVYDEYETRSRLQYLKRRKKFQLDLEFTRKIVADEHYPVNINYEHPQRDDWEIMFGEHEMHFGRLYIAEMLAIYRHTSAIPELREVLFHDDNPFMRDAAFTALYGFATPESIAVILEYLKTDFPPSMLFFICMTVGAREIPSLSTIMEYHFERLYYDYKEKAYRMESAITDPQQIVELCGFIGDTHALTIIEKGLQHPYGFVQKTAFKALQSWVWKNSQIALLHKDKQHTQVPIEIVAKIIKKYGLYDYKYIMDNFSRRRHEYEIENILKK